MKALRRVLALQAAVWAFAGVALLIAPKFVLVTLFDQSRHQEFAWMRLVGIHAVGLAMLMVLVGRRVEELWWWSWGFALVTVVTAAIVLLNAAFGLAPHESGVLWWTFAAIAAGFSVALLFGLYQASKEQPFPG
jgi:hypothetical protein